MGLKPEDTGKVEPKSNLGPRLQFRTGESRIFPRAEIVQVVSKNACNLWKGLAMLPSPPPRTGACGLRVSGSEKRKPWLLSENMKTFSN